MHELGIVFYIIKDVKNVAIKNNLKKVKKVVLEIGEVSGVVASYLYDCWIWAIKKEEILNECSLVFEDIKAKSICLDCNTTFDTVKNGKICPKCKKNNTELLIGNEVNIKYIEV